MADAGDDVDNVVGDLQQLEAVVDLGAVLRLPDAALDDQRVGAAFAEREDVDVVQVAGAEDLPTVGIEQAPGQAVGTAAQLLAVEVVARTGRGVKAKNGGFVGRVELTTDDAVAGKRGRRGKVEEPEAEIAGLIALRVE
ncbi:MAG: hypothetical protein V5B40_20365, partial [Candidatus Accumulibacter meliphilus]|uniref:hypothetical protein n=1 Tax=Candidatus Accumulibacter meliphilus TaxID=2211374 RepID=UPI002FC34C54